MKLSKRVYAANHLRLSQNEDIWVLRFDIVLESLPALIGIYNIPAKTRERPTFFWLAANPQTFHVTSLSVPGILSSWT